MTVPTVERVASFRGNELRLETKSMPGTVAWSCFEFTAVLMSSRFELTSAAKAVVFGWNWIKAPTSIAWAVKGPPATGTRAKIATSARRITWSPKRERPVLSRS